MPRLPPRLVEFIKRCAKRLYLHWVPMKTRRFRETSPSDAVVVMNLWNRPNRLPDVLRMLDGQSTDRGIRLLLWNNARKDHETYERVVREFEPRGVLASVSLVRSPFNLGSMSRFYLARQLARREGSRPFIVLDDDENVESDFVARALDAYDPGALTAFWAFRAHRKNYSERDFAAPGEFVNHIGPGGMVADAAFFLDDGFFRKMPEQFWLLDDVWLSAYGPSRGYRLAKLDVDIEFVMDETNSYRSFIDSKQAFYELLAPMREAAGTLDPHQ